MKTKIQTIEVETPDGGVVDVNVQIRFEYNRGTPGSLSDAPGWEVVDVTLLEDVE